MKRFISAFVLLFLLGLSILITDQVFFSATSLAANPSVRVVTDSNQLVLASLADASNTKASLAGDIKINYEKQVDEQDISDLMNNNWGKLVLAALGLLDVVVRLTPTKKDNSIFNLVTRVLNHIIPNRKNGGGTF